MDTMGERLRWARERAGFRSARSAALENGWVEVTYRSHETNGRAFDLETAQKYGRVFKVDPLWLLHGFGQSARASVAVVGIAGANPDGSILFGEGQATDDEAPMPPNGTARTVAVEVRGDSMRGIAENGWWVYYEDRRDPPTDDLLGRICVVGLADGRVLIKRLIRGRKRKHFDLESFAAPTLYDMRVDWAAPVTAIIPSENVSRVRARGAA